MAEQQTLINLSKAVKINLAKVTQLKIVAQVGLLDDVSGSAHNMHLMGVTQRLFDRLFAVAFEFDDNAVLDAWAFDTEAYELTPIVESMFGNYVKKYIVDNNSLRIWGGTAYRPGMQAVVDHYYPGPNTVAVAAQEFKAEAKSLFGKVANFFGGKKEEPAPAKKAFTPVSATVKLPDPAYCMMVTDGENGDGHETLALLREHADKQIFWMIIGITEGNRQNFKFLQQLEHEFPNVGFYNAGQIDDVSNDELYSKMFTPKFIKWYEAARKAV